MSLVECSWCKGTGVEHGEKCDLCKGTGKMRPRCASCGETITEDQEARAKELTRVYSGKTCNNTECERDYRIEQAQTARRQAFGEPLELRQESGGWRHYLKGDPVHCGMGLELYMDTPTCPDAYLPVRYEASGLGHGPREDVRTFFYARVGTVSPNLKKACFRWPPKPR